MEYSPPLSDLSIPIFQPPRPVINEPTRRNLSWFMGGILLINTTIGAGILNFHAAFYQAHGIFITVFIEIVMLLFIVTSMIILLSVTQITYKKFENMEENSESINSYEQIIEFYCGKAFKYIASIVIILYSFGTCVTYLIIIADQQEQMKNFLMVEPHQADNIPALTRKNLLIFISVLTILPLCYSKRIDFLKYPSMCGMGAVFYLPFAVMYEFYDTYYMNPSTLKHKTLALSTSATHHLTTTESLYKSAIFPYLKTLFRDFDMTGVLRIVPTICFLYNAQLSVVPIYNSMQDSEHPMPNFIKSILFNIIVCFFLYNVTAIYGYLSFGESVKDYSDLLKAYQPVDFKIFFANGFILAKILLTYPIVLFCARITILSCLKIAVPITPVGRVTPRFGIQYSSEGSYTEGAAPDSNSTTTGSDSDELLNSSPFSSNEGDDFTFSMRSYLRTALRSVGLCLYQKYRAVKYTIKNDLEMYARVFISTSWFILTLYITLNVPDIGKIIPFLGTLALLLLFVFPACALISYLTNPVYQTHVRLSNVNFDISILNASVDEVEYYIFHYKRTSFTIALFIIVFGVFLFGTVFTQTLIETFIFKGY